jgi:hypothetical protein
MRVPSFEGDPKDEARMRVEDTGPRDIIQWFSKAWTDHELKLPVFFYRETLARLLVLERYRNLIGHRMTPEWHEEANATMMALPACGRSVHHVPFRWVLPVLLRRGNREAPTVPEWECEVLSHEVIIHRHCLRTSKRLLCTAVYDDKDSAPRSEPDFGAPSS